MTTQKTVTAEDVETTRREVRWILGWGGHIKLKDALDRVCDTAAQVPALVADNAALLKAGRRWAEDESDEDDSREALVAALRSEHPGAALLAEHEAQVSALQARVAELEQSLAFRDDNYANEQDMRLKAESERDTLRAQVETVRARATDAEAARQVLLAWDSTSHPDAGLQGYGHAAFNDLTTALGGVFLALSTPPAEAKTPEPVSLGSMPEGFAGVPVRVLWSTTEGEGHTHTVQVVACRFPGGEEVPYLQVAEAGGPLAGARTLAISTAVHALRNLGEMELFQLGNRDPEEVDRG